MKTKMMTKALAVLTLAGAMSVAAPQAASAGDACDLRSYIDEATQWGSIKNVNVMIYKGSSRQSSHFDNVVQSGSWGMAPCASNKETDFHWVLFKGDGEFVRKGDGGYRNWAFSGIWDRPSDTVVKFHRR